VTRVKEIESRSLPEEQERFYLEKKGGEARGKKISKKLELWEGGDKI